MWGPFSWGPGANCPLCPPPPPSWRPCSDAHKIMVSVLNVLTRIAVQPLACRQEVGVEEAEGEATVAPIKIQYTQSTTNIITHNVVANHRQLPTRNQRSITQTITDAYQHQYSALEYQTREPHMLDDILQPCHAHPPDRPSTQ